MPKFILLLALFAANIATLTAQYIPLVEESKYWIYARHYDIDSPNLTSGFLLKFDGDTTVNNLAYKKVYRQTLSGTHPCPEEEQPCFTFDIPYNPTDNKLIGLIRENNSEKQVYYTPLSSDGCDDNEYLLFDFSLTVDEPLDACKQDALGGQPGFGVVDSITQVDWYDKVRTTINTWGYESYIGLLVEGNVRIMEGIGFERFGLFHKVNNPNTLVNFCQGTLEDCGILSAISPLAKDIAAITIAPNPAGQHLSITSDHSLTAVRAIDLQGRPFSLKGIANEYDLSGIPAGLYVLEAVNILGQISRVKFIKIEN